MTREEAHNLVDKLYNLEERTSDAVLGLVDNTTENQAILGANELIQPVRELPKDKRVVRTKASGDRVYLLDEVKKSRAWVTNPEVLKSLGFELNDVGDVDEEEMLRYQMSAALYRLVDEDNTIN